MGQVQGKVALVTGGASGIGAGCARKLAQEGAKVMVSDIDVALGSAVVADIERAGGEAAFMAHDVTQEDQWQKVIAETLARWGKLDILVNNAGVGMGGPIAEMSLEDWRKQTAINLDGVFLGTKHAARAMRDKGGGAIVNMSSVAGFKGAAMLAGYCATKGGVRLFTKACALEFAQLGYNIRVNSVHPGIIDTPIWTKIPQGGSQLSATPRGANAMDPVALAAMAAPLKRPGTPEDVANGVLYLASDAASYVTGTELIVDGGMVAR
jgi:NAD(P)-dependent dehydrogenase (short-subunit alcohol dehydrogenase family)